jgi:hypothetical protein
MTHPESSAPTTFWRRFLPLTLGLVILSILLLTPMKRWLNQIPYLWEVLYPLLTLFAGYLVVDAVRNREEPGIIATWSLLFLATLSALLFTYTGDRLFYTFSRWGAFIFVGAQVIDTALGVGWENEDA